MLKVLRSVPADVRFAIYVMVLLAGAIVMALGYVTPTFVNEVIANAKFLIGATLSLVGLLASANISPRE